MNNVLRIPLRFAALLLVFAGLAAFVIPIVQPFDTARALGESCGRTKQGNIGQCTVMDTISLFWSFGGIAVIGGLIAVGLLRRPGGDGTLTLDLSRS